MDGEDGELSSPHILLVSRLDVEDGEVSSPQILLDYRLDGEDGEVSSPQILLVSRWMVKMESYPPLIFSLFLD